MKKTITTAGSGSASGTPDALRVSVAVVSQAASVSDALARTASGVSAVGEVARTFTTERHIASTGLNVWPAHDQDGRQSGYEARHTLSLFCDDLGNGGLLVTALGELSDRALIQSVSPTISDPRPLAVAAREGAFTDARAKADELAGLAGLTVVGPIAIVEGGGSAAPVAREMMLGKADTSFEAGSEEVTAYLSVTWKVE